MTKISRFSLSVLLTTTAIAGASAAIAQDAPQAAPITDDVIVVRGANIPDEKRATPEISNVLDSEDFSRQGDDDIAAALRRVAGLSLSQGRFVVVRGLNERYSYATLNGAPLPSPEPLRRVAPLDLFPTAILSGSLVQKTYSPQYSGEFGGGVIELRTRALPEEGFFEFGGSVGLDSVTTFSDGLLYPGGNTDWLGFDNGTREIPNFEAGGFNINNAQLQSLSFAQRNQFDAAFENSDTLLINENQVAPNWGLEATFGDRYDLNADWSVGFVGTLGYSSDWQTRDGKRQRAAFQSGSASTTDTLTEFESTTNDVTLNGLFSIGAEYLSDHSVDATFLIVRKTTKEARVTEGFNIDDLLFREEKTEFFERQVWQGQLNGEHLFPAVNDLVFSWQVAYGEAFRDAPYERNTPFIPIAADGTEIFVDFDSGLGPQDVNFGVSLSGQSVGVPTISFSKVEDENFSANFDFDLPFDLFGFRHGLKFGYAYTEVFRESLNRDFEIRFNLDEPILSTLRPDILFGDAVPQLDDAFVSIPGSGLAVNEYDGALQVGAAYAGLELELSDFWRLSVGGRFEDGNQSVVAKRFLEPIANSAGPAFIYDEIDEDYFLPAITATWNPVGNFQIRAAFSQTITRPQFRELGPSLFTDTDTDITFFGNPFLKNSEIENFDARAEWYPARGQSVTLGIFFKDIENPIEEYSTTVGDNFFTSFINAPSAEVFGGEAEFERNFVLADFVGGEWAATKDLILKANYTYTDSEVSNDGEVIIASVPSAGGVSGDALNAQGLLTDGRSLQGQSDHLVNFQLGYEDIEANSSATILVNWASERIRSVGTVLGTNVIPDVLEKPPVTVDFVYNRSFEMYGGEYEISLKVQNILADDYEAIQEGVSSDGDAVEIPFDTYELGRGFSIGLKRRF